MLEKIQEYGEFIRIYKVSCHLPDSIAERLKKLLSRCVSDLVWLAKFEYHVDEVFFALEPDIDPDDADVIFLPVVLKLYYGIDDTDSEAMQAFVSDLEKVLSEAAGREIRFPYDQVWFAGSQSEKVHWNSGRGGSP